MLVGLHDINGRTLRSLTSALGVPAAIIIIELDKVDTSGAFTADAAYIDVKLQGATKVIVPVGPVGGVVIRVVKDKGAIVQSHLNLVIFGLKIFSIKASHVEFPRATKMIAVTNEFLQLCWFWLGLRLIFIIFFLTTVVFLLVIIGIGSRWLRSGRLRLWAGIRCSIVSGTFGVTPLVDLEVGDLVDGVFTACGSFSAHLRALFNGFVSSISVIPRGDNEAHATFDVSAKAPEIVLAASLHHNLVNTLSDSCAHLPEFLVVDVRNKLSLDGELFFCLDLGTIGTIGVLSVFFLALLKHVILALALVITVAIMAGVSRYIEAVWIGLHNVDAGA